MKSDSLGNFLNILAFAVQILLTPEEEKEKETKTSKALLVVTYRSFAVEFSSMTIFCGDLTPPPPNIQPWELCGEVFDWTLNSDGMGGRGIEIIPELAASRFELEADSNRVHNSKSPGRLHI